MASLPSVKAGLRDHPFSGGLARGAGGANAPPADTKRRAPKLRQGANIPKLLKKILYSR